MSCSSKKERARMSREKEDYRENLNLITEHFGDGQLITLRAAADYLGVHFRKLQNDKSFPLKKVGGRYYVPAVSLARWMS